MIPDIGNDFIPDAVTFLADTIGLKETVNLKDLMGTDAQSCVDNVVAHFGLPVRVSIRYVPYTYSPYSTSRFSSTDIVVSDRSGGGEGIVAQVSLPTNLPLFGSKALEGYPIDLAITDNLYRRKDTFFALIAHEMAHVLLHSLRYPEKDSEIHTDLVPLLLGMGPIVRIGRKHSETTTQGSSQVTNTTTYGYLTDKQFNNACRVVSVLITHHHEMKLRLKKTISWMQRSRKRLVNDVETFQTLMSYLDQHQPSKMSKEDGMRIVSFHQKDAVAPVQSLIREIDSIFSHAHNFVGKLKHYTEKSILESEALQALLDKYLDRMSQASTGITKDNKMLKKYVGIGLKLKLLQNELMNPDVGKPKDSASF